MTIVQIIHKQTLHVQYAGGQHARCIAIYMGVRLSVDNAYRGGCFMCRCPYGETFSRGWHRPSARMVICGKRTGICWVRSGEKVRRTCDLWACNEPAFASASFPSYTNNTLPIAFKGRRWTNLGVNTWQLQGQTRGLCGCAHARNAVKESCIYGIAGHIYYIYRKFSPVVRLGGLAPARPIIGASLSEPHLGPYSGCGLCHIIGERERANLVLQLGRGVVIYVISYVVGARQEFTTWAFRKTCNYVNPTPRPGCY